jgi:hypothetical protein
MANAAGSQYSVQAADRAEHNSATAAWTPAMTQQQQQNAMLCMLRISTLVHRYIVTTRVGEACNVSFMLQWWYDYQRQCVVCENQAWHQSADTCTSSAVASV